MAEPTIDAVVFDYGGVLTTPIRVSTAAWLAAEDIEPDLFTGIMREWLGARVEHGTPVHLLETGELPGPQFERALAARLRTVHGDPVAAAGLLDRLFAGMRVDPAMIELVGELRDMGLRVGLLSNSWGNHYPDDIEELCDAVVISGRVGLRKPDPRIYALALDGLGVPARRTAFVDDAPVNVAAATELGMRAVRHVDAATTRATLARWVPDLAAVHQ